MIIIDYETAVQDLKEIVKGKEDYVYVNPHGQKVSPMANIICYYFDPDTEKPSCIVGHVLAKHGVTYKDVSTNNFGYLINAVDEAGISIPYPAMSFLEKVQGSQDVGVPWGKALEMGLSYEHGGF